MRYLCLAYYDPGKFAALAPEAVQALVGQCPAKDEALRATGRLFAGASLGGAEQAFSIRPRGGQPVVTDGPYTESKEVVGGFVIVEAQDREEAIRLASMHPAATLGEDVGWGLEVHPIGRYLGPER